MKKLEELWFRFFSESTINTKDWWVRYVVYATMFLPMLTGVIINVVKGEQFGLAWVLVGGGILVVFGIIWIVTWFYHIWRIKHEV
jgi:hypothetical protein